ncbi:MAG: M23 family metallopeptidase [Tidjanibacter sp.]|nr:M23 family metallopeptidase [Tidjanibacter sp.]
MLKRYKQGTLRNGAAETRERMKEMVRTGCRRLRLSVGVCLVCAALQGGTAHAQDYGKPLDMPVLQSSSNFGKLRSTRFHSGVDFRTGGVEGKRVLAVEDGQIYRIGVKPYGYGNVVYVAHPDGNISVYGHLSKFTPEVEAYVRSERYRQQRNDIDLFPEAGRFPVKRGEVIGLSGNSGNSFGPHLHFEIREGASQRTVNPIARGYYRVKDDLPPRIFGVSYYLVDTLMGVPVHTLAGRAAAIGGSGARYTLEAPMVLPGRGYFCVETMDRKNDVSGSMATYRIVLSVDGQTRLEYLMDGFTFGENHFAKVLSDYMLNGTTSNDVFRLAVLNEGAMPFYPRAVGRGLIDPASGIDEVRIEVEDDSGNTAVLTFPVTYDPSAAAATVSIPTDAEAVDFRRHYSRTTDGLKVTIPAGALYESLFYEQEKLSGRPAVTVGKGTHILSDFYAVHDASVPLQAPVTLSFRADVPEELRERVVIARLTDKGRLAAAPAKYADGAVTGRASLFGIWCAAADTVNPTVTPSFRSGTDMSGERRIGFRISDDFSGVASYSATVDGEWVMLEHDTVHGMLYHYFDDEVCGTGRRHEVELRVTDGAGNTAVYRGSYYR